MRLLVHVEGETEETFVKEVLAPHLYGAGYSSVAARKIGSARPRKKRGGARPWPSVREGILHHLNDDRASVSTTMVDYYGYYGLPASGSARWPGRAEAESQPFAARAVTVQQAIAQNIREHMDAAFVPDRFIAYVSMHEFEALLFSDCDAFAQSIGLPAVAAELQRVRDSFGDPEQIDDSRETAPSKRIRRLVPTYDKVVMGSVAIQEIGLHNIRSQCPNFRQWLTRLEEAARP